MKNDNATQRGHDKMFRNGQRVRVILRRYGTFDQLAHRSRTATFRFHLDVYGDRAAAIFCAKHMIRLDIPNEHRA